MGLIGYARISTIEGAQVMDRQLDALNAAGCERIWGLMPEGAESYALMSVFGFLCMAKLPRRSGLVKSCSLCRHWRRLAEPMVIMLSSAGWVPPDQIRCGLASL